MGEHIKERHGYLESKIGEKPSRAIDRPEENQPFIKRFKAEVEKRLRKLAAARSVSDKLDDTTLSEDDEDSTEDNLESEDKDQETDEREVEVTVTRGQRLAVMKYNLECLLKETRDLKRVLVMEENDNDI